MKLFPQMTCCKSGRRLLELKCEAPWMVLCLAGHCARLPTPQERRVFSAEVAGIGLILRAGLQGEYTAAVERLLKRERASTATKSNAAKVSK